MGQYGHLVAVQDHFDNLNISAAAERAVLPGCCVVSWFNLCAVKSYEHGMIKV